MINIDAAMVKYAYKNVKNTAISVLLKSFKNVFLKKIIKMLVDVNNF